MSAPKALARGLAPSAEATAAKKPKLAAEKGSAAGATPAKAGGASAASVPGAGGGATTPTEDEALSFREGQRAMCKWRDGTEHLCEILDKRNEDKKAEFYVHYVDYNRRLDEWVGIGRLAEADAQMLRTQSAPKASAESEAGKSGKLTRHQKRRIEESMVHLDGGHSDTNPAMRQLEKEHEESTKVKNISRIQLGRYEIDCWYFSPYPDGYAQETLYLCESTLKYFRKRKTLAAHKGTLKSKTPPGKRIYEDMSNSLVGYELDGKEHKLFCQNLCLLAKLFLDHKTLYYDVEPFLFYVFCERDSEGAEHIIGYFSKEKCSMEDYNLACILTLPPYQRKGYGKFLIAFSYELSIKEQKLGTPERPLSDLGQLSYRSYWGEVLVELLWQEKARKQATHSTVKEMAMQTSIKHEDIIQTLQSLGLIQYWKGQYIVNPSQKALDEHRKQMSTSIAKRKVVFKPECLDYTPPTFKTPSLQPGASPRPGGGGSMR